MELKTLIQSSEQEIELTCNLMTIDQLYMFQTSMESLREELESEYDDCPSGVHYFDTDVFRYFSETSSKEDEIMEDISKVNNILNILDFTIFNYESK